MVGKRAFETIRRILCSNALFRPNAYLKKERKRANFARALKNFAVAALVLPVIFAIYAMAIALSDAGIGFSYLLVVPSMAIYSIVFSALAGLIAGAFFFAWTKAFGAVKNSVEKNFYLLSITAIGFSVLYAALGLVLFALNEIGLIVLGSNIITVFSPLVWILFSLPFFWSFIILVFAVKHANNISGIKAAIAVIIPIIVLFALFLAAGQYLQPA
ncbi:hypothetical protein HY993_01290 [Candidatus Micrarchaeota archaeon]|nr:hypothetical protein [Candidatus Micrarchaeota archaeon]